MQQVICHSKYVNHIGLCLIAGLSSLIYTPHYAQCIPFALPEIIGDHQMLMYIVCVPLLVKTPSQLLLPQCSLIPFLHSGIIPLDYSAHSLACTLAFFIPFGLFSISVDYKNVPLQLVKRRGQVIIDKDFVVEVRDLGMLDLGIRRVKSLFDLIIRVGAASAKAPLQLLQTRCIDKDESGRVRLVFELLDALCCVRSCM